MRKKLLCVVLTVAMVISATGCDGNNKTDILPNKVKEQVEKEEKNQKFKEVDGKMEVYLPVHYTCSRTESGNKDMVVHDEGSFTYDSDGLLVEDTFHDESNTTVREWYSYDNSSSYQYNTEYQMMKAHKNEQEDKVEYSYDYEDGKLICYGIDDTTINHEYYDYFNKETGLVEEYEWNEGETKYSYEFDENGMIAKCSSHTSFNDNEYDDFTRYKYDEKGNVIEKIPSDLNENIEKYVKYDKNGYIVSIEGLCSYDVLDNTPILFTYNEQHKPEQIKNNGYDTTTYQYENNLISRITVDGNEGYTLQYDENGNLVEMTNSLDKGFKMSIQYKPYYVDKEYFDYYLSCYYYRYLDAPFEQSMDYNIHLYITEINQDVLQGKLRSSFCNLPYIAPEDVYVGNPFKVDNK